ncbi:Cell division protein FtsH [Patulibacter medicamentivorans]|uniref:ATP-dependent zinc metalloprotease FtsH n=1 Tax=Patulibacter medicamentivorans TaxID=1097667 RepID=H0E1B5_9ACTN|nr:ATP-dependent zinc metalloprotease FtsH [Patulibacter medicamentivorans]EHN12554.1 Cell division protein FtsH [Patulibacter medicamentivorans]
MADPQPTGEPKEPDAQSAGRRWPSIWMVVVTVVAINWLIAAVVSSSDRTPSVPYSVFRQQAEQGNVLSVRSQAETIEGRFRRAVQVVDGDRKRETTTFETERPAFADDALLGLLLGKKVKIDARPPAKASPLLSILIGVVPTLLILGVLFYAMRHAGGGGGLFGTAGRSKARRYEATGTGTSFRDVAGIDEATDELAEVVDFLRHPERYRRLGATVPRGVLLTGPPGTGKTLLARAVAGEAEVPFFSLSASEFVEMFVGVGASRVRDLFAQAKSSAPSIVFIDELDAIGRSRGSGGPTGSNEEREQTLNQILTEMDGFTGTEGVIILAATNRPEILDPALLRAGRFDRRIAVNPPDRVGREKILRVHTRSVPLDERVDLATIAAQTPGMVGADLRTLVNEAALGAARAERAAVAPEDFADALERLMLGAARRIVLSYGDRRRTAYHESGHALLGVLQPGADPVRKVSIIPRGHALGVTFQSPSDDRYGYGEPYLRGRITGMLGGRASEQLVLGEITTGAESDLEQATALARQMVGRWGMSEKLGLLTALPNREGGVIGFAGLPAGTSERTLELIDVEARRILDDCYRDAVRTLREHRDELDALAAALLVHETLDEEAIYATVGRTPVAPASSPNPASTPTPTPAPTPTPGPEPAVGA